MRFLWTNFALTVAITGHRKIERALIPHVNHELGQIFCQLARSSLEISEAGREKGFFVQPPILRLASCLSEGSDRLAAAQALDKNFLLQAVLPFPLESPGHALDLSGPAKQQSLRELHALCNRAESILQLMPDIPPWLKNTDVWSDSGEANAWRQQAYALASRKMLDFSDILIAVWNGRPQESPGGTFDTILQAFKRNMLVCVISTSLDSSFRTVWNEEDLFSPSSSLCLHDEIIKRYGIKGIESSVDDTLSAEKIEVYDEHKLPVLARLWTCFHRKTGKNRVARIKESDCCKIRMTLPETEIFRTYDRSAVYCAAMYRSSVLLLALLTLFAIITGALAAGLPDFASRDAAIIVLNLVEVILILCAIINVKRAKSRHWQNKLTSYRMTAEIMRLNNFADKIGVCIPYQTIYNSLYSKNSSIKWHMYFLRNGIRCMGFSSFNMGDKEQFLKLRSIIDQELINGQLCYHKINSARSDAMYMGLERLTNVLFKISLLVLCIQGIFVLLFHLDSFEPLLSFIATVGPALAAASQTISQNTELKRLALRSEHLAEALFSLHEKFNEIHSPAELQAITLDAIQLLLDDVNDWKDQYNIAEMNVS